MAPYNQIKVMFVEELMHCFLRKNVGGSSVIRTPSFCLHKEYSRLGCFMRCLQQGRLLDQTKVNLKDKSHKIPALGISIGLGISLILERLY